MFDIPSNVLTLAISVLTNVTLAVTTIYQVHTDKKLRIEEQRVRMQCEAYMRYFQEFTLSGEADASRLFAATAQATLVSSPQNAERLFALADEYCRYLEHPDDREAFKNMISSMFALEKSLHEELIPRKANIFVRSLRRIKRLLKR